MKSLASTIVPARAAKALMRAGVLAASLVAGIVLRSAPAYAVDWSQFHFSPSQRGTNPYETVLTPKTVGGLHRQWSADTGGMSWTSALQVGKKAIVGSAGGLRAYDRATGDPLWTFASSGGVGHAIAAAHGMVYAQADSFVAVDAANGHLLWSRDLQGGEGGPVVVGGIVYTPDGGSLWALDAATGATVWKQTPSQCCQVITTPAVAGGLVVVSGEFTTFAYHAEDGTLAWRSDLGISFDAPAISGGSVYGEFWGAQTSLAKHDLGTGQTIWRREISGRWIPGSTPAIASGMVFYHLHHDRSGSHAYDTMLIAVNARTGDVLWRRTTEVAGPRASITCRRPAWPAASFTWEA